MVVQEHDTISTQIQRGPAQLKRYAQDTFTSVLSMLNPKTGLPANRILHTANNEVVSSPDSTPTDMALVMAVLISAVDLGIMEQSTAHAQIGKIISTISDLESYHGLFYNWYDVETGDTTTTHHSGGVVEPFVSTVDNAWVLASLMLVSSAVPDHANQANELLSRVDFPQLYDSSQDLFWGGYYPEVDRFTPHHYTALGSEIRIAPYIGISQFQLSPRSYQTLYETKKKKGAVICSWGGSMFEALLPPLLIPESKWSREWSDSHRSYIDHQVRYGRRYTDGYWGLSPCDDPSNTYLEFGVGNLGVYRGYGRSMVITPHASFLALPYKERVARSNLARIEGIKGAYRPGFGFADSVDVSTGAVASSHLAIDDSMILLSIAEASGLGVSRYLERRLENTIRPVLEMN